MIGVGLIGYGYWGPNLARNFAECDGTRLLAVCDQDSERLNLAARRYPGIDLHTQPEKLLSDSRIDAVAIATPVASHFELARTCLQGGKHVLLEKPLTETSAQGHALIEEAERRRLVLLVDHTFLYTPAVQRIHDILCQGEAGELYYYDSVRVNLGLFQHDVGVLFDLAVHDIAIMDYLLGVDPVAVSACGVSHVAGRAEDLAYVTFFFPGNVVAHIHVNWLAPVKLRRTVLSGKRKMIVYDDLEASEKVKVYDKGLVVGDTPDERHRTRVSYRTGDMWAPHLATTEALRHEVEDFVHCIETGSKPLSDGKLGLRVVRLLEAAAQSLRERGRPVEIGSLRDSP
jgi:predicted dehydrogenase